MANCMVFHTQIASIMEVLANAAVAEVCKLVDDDYAVFRLEITQSQKENRSLRRKLQLLELKVSRERAERTMRERVYTSPRSVKLVDAYRGMARGEGHLTGSHRSFVKPGGHNTWRDDKPITVDEEIGTSTQHIILIENADAEAADPGVKQEKSEGEEDPQHSRDIQIGAPPESTEDLAATPQPKTRRSIMEVSGTPNDVLKSETDTETLTVTHRLLHTGSDQRSDPERMVLGRLGCPPPGSEYLPVLHQNQRMVNSHGDGDTLDPGGDDLSCSYTTATDPGNMPLGLETQTDLFRGDWNRYSSSVYTEGCLDKKGEGLVVNEVTVKVEDDTPLTWNADKTHLGEGHLQGNTSDFLDYSESLETNLNVATHSSLHTFGDRDPVSTSLGPSDSQNRILFDQVLNSNNRARVQAQGGGVTSGNIKEKRFLCMFCNKSFRCLQNVEIHQRVHTGEKPFSCTQCHMRFAQAGTLKRHQRVHTGVKPFSCTQCHMCFAQAGDLKRHQRVHTGERPFTCNHCGKKFSQRSYLRIHLQKNHSTP